MEIEDSKYDTLKVLICDDSALMRNLVSRIINDTPGMQVVGKAMNGKMQSHGDDTGTSSFAGSEAERK